MNMIEDEIGDKGLISHIKELGNLLDKTSKSHLERSPDRLMIGF